MQKKNHNHLAILYVSAVIFVAGCATVEQGRNFDATKAQSFQKGKTSRADIIAAMGEPSSTGIDSDGSFIEYQYLVDKANGMTMMLTAYGIGSSKVESKAKHCKFMFNASDKLRDFACSEGDAKGGASRGM